MAFDPRSPATARPQGTFGQTLCADIQAWCEGRLWLPRLPIWAYLAYVGARQWANPGFSAENLFAGLNLGIHEGGHLIFRFVGEFLCIAAGSGLQCAVPILSIFMFFKQRDYFAISVCLGWLGINLVHVGVYMRDAQAMILPLVTVGGGGDTVIHDWNWLFRKMGLLSWSGTLSWLTGQAGNLMLLACVTSGGWLLWRMFRSGQRTKTNPAAPLR